MQLHASLLGAVQGGSMPSSRPGACAPAALRPPDGQLVLWATSSPSSAGATAQGPSSEVISAAQTVEADSHTCTGLYAFPCWQRLRAGTLRPGVAGHCGGLPAWVCAIGSTSLIGFLFLSMLGLLAGTLKVCVQKQLGRKGNKVPASWAISGKGIGHHSKLAPEALLSKPACAWQKGTRHKHTQVCTGDFSSQKPEMKYICHLH